jgi:hypothetical protein
MKKATMVYLAFMVVLGLYAQEAKTLISTKQPIAGLVTYRRDDPLSIDGKNISRSEYIALAKKNCTDAYKLYKKGTGMKVGGIIMTSVGIAGVYTSTLSLFAGIIGLTTGSSYYKTVSLCSLGGLAVSGGLIGGGIPLWVKGMRRRKQSFQLYNEHIKNTYNDVTLSVQSSNNGIGMAVIF